LHTFDAFNALPFRFLWASNMSLYISRWMQTTTLSWFVYNETQSAFMVGLINFFGMAPFLLFGLFGGIIADRLNKKILIVFTQFLTLITAAIMTLLMVFDLLEIWHVFIGIFIPGLCWALDMPSRRSLIMDMLGSTRITNGIALDSVGMHLSKMAGPAIGGALIAFTGVAGSYIFLTTVIFLGWFLLLGVKPNVTSPYSQTAKTPEHLILTHHGFVETTKFVFMELKAGFSYAFTNQIIAAVIVITVLMNLLLFPYMQMITVISGEVLFVGPLLMGILMASDGLGALMGSISLASINNMHFHGRYYFYGSILSLLALLFFSFSNTYIVSLILLIFLGMGTAGFGTMQSAIVLLVSKKEFRGRCMGVITIGIGASPLGSLFLGLIAEQLSTQSALRINAVIGLFLVIAAGFFMSAIRGRILPDINEKET
jgi:MFS family permease